MTAPAPKWRPKLVAGEGKGREAPGIIRATDAQSYR